MDPVKESFDDLPMAVCFFDSRGLVRLINRRMLRLSSVLIGSGLPTLDELRSALSSPPEGIAAIDPGMSIYRFPDGSVFRFEESCIADERGAEFTQVTASDITELSRLHDELKKENARLDEANRRARQLYENMADIVREEEILAMKMRVHDDIGYTIISARRALRSGESIEAVKASAAVWERSVDLLRRSGRAAEAPVLPEAADPVERALTRAAALGVSVDISGDVPEDAELRELFSLVLLECVSNCAKHAGGGRVFAEAAVTCDGCRVEVSNDGRPPAGEIREGGGLSGLRSRIEGAGGEMTVFGLPRFRLVAVLRKRAKTG